MPRGRGAGMVNIGSVAIAGKLCLAPMAGVADAAFRAICRGEGAAYAVSEMIYAKALMLQDSKTRTLLKRFPEDAPLGVQLFGSEPETMADAAKKARDLSGCEIIDVNMGCPVGKVVRNGEGSALMRDPEKCRAIVAAVKGAVPVPVTVKMRIGWDENSLNAVEVALACEAGGVDGITVHGRTRADLYRDGTVRPEEIKKVVDAVHVPVIANGDVRDEKSARAMLEATGAAGLAIGRGALGHPWVFAEIRAALAGEEPRGVDKREVMRAHVALAFRYKPVAAAGELRTHMAHYLKGFRGAAALRAAVSAASTPADYEDIISRLPPDF